MKTKMIDIVNLKQLVKDNKIDFTINEDVLYCRDLENGESVSLGKPKYRGLRSGMSINEDKIIKKKCKDCSSCNLVEYERRNNKNENYKVQRYECWGVKEPFEIKDINQYCTEY